MKPKNKNGNWFTNKDHTFCVLMDCPLKDSCCRFTDNYDWNDESDNYISIFAGQIENCELYVGAYKNAKKHSRV